MGRITIAEQLQNVSKVRFDRKQKSIKRMFVRTKRKTLWGFACKTLSILIPEWMLSLFGMKSKNERDAWREKFALCVLIFFSCCLLAFLTYGMNMFVCKSGTQNEFSKLKNRKKDSPFLLAKGGLYEIEPEHKHFDTLQTLKFQNATALFKQTFDSCKTRFNGDVMARGLPNIDIFLRDDTNLIFAGPIYFQWADIARFNYIVINGIVCDASANTEEFYEAFIEKNRGKDASSLIKNWDEEAKQCFTETFAVGKLLTRSYGCLFSDLVLYISTVAIFGLILVRFVLAAFYFWHIRRRMAVLSRTTKKVPCITLVTAYSEDRAGIAGTLNSLAVQDYDTSSRIIVVVADGKVTGSGSEQTTPQILLDLVQPYKGWVPEPKEYIALAAGNRRLNRAMVVPGTYTYRKRTVEILLILKTGSDSETGHLKAGNRGKRDSQVIVMGFFQRLIFNDPLVPLDYEIFRALSLLKQNIHPASYEAILMLDADTIVQADALSKMLALLANDDMVIGMCGETKISNKSASWVTAIQVFEYYISHHLNKAFESVFGGVTCIPGCFGMYRIQQIKFVGKDTYSLPLLAHPFILNPYSSIETRTLHQKNLLLLGEDRYLTTLLLKHFFARKLVFNPTAICRTEVPSQFSVLLSQRRRWINSTIHNYFELALVDQLCGTFCCSMKFVVIMELMGTLILPAAIFFTGVLIIVAFLIEPAWIPLIMLFGILGLPAVLIAITTFDITQVFWLLVYIISLPVWNFVLPVYAFWHFDDFSWGETRKIEGLVDKGHADGEGEFDLKNMKVAMLDDWIRKDPIYRFKI